MIHQDRPELIHLPDPAVIRLDRSRPVDWSEFIARFVSPNQSPTGAGLPHHNVGTIGVGGRYQLHSTLSLSPFAFLRGAWRPGWNLGNSPGFWASENFKGSTLLEWELPGKNKYYQSFCSGATDIFLDCNDTCNGLQASLSQQSELSHCRIKNFGRRTGLMIGGDVWSISHCIIDRDRSGQRTPPVGDGSIAIATFGQRLADASIVKTTIHNCEIGIVLGDSTGCDIELELETTRIPIQLTYNCVGDSFRTRILHADCICSITQARHRNFHVRLAGETRQTLNRILLPGDREHWLTASRQKSGFLFRYDVTVLYRNGELTVEQN